MACIIHYKSLGYYSELKHVTTNTEIGDYGKPKLLENVPKVKIIMRSSATKFL